MADFTTPSPYLAPSDPDLVTKIYKNTFIVFNGHCSSPVYTGVLSWGDLTIVLGLYVTVVVNSAFYSTIMCCYFYTIISLYYNSYTMAI